MRATTKRIVYYKQMGVHILSNGPKRKGENVVNQTTAVVRLCTGGNADDMGETWAWPFPSSSDARRGGTLVLGVAGVPTVFATLPMNHDYRRSDETT